VIPEGGECCDYERQYRYSNLKRLLLRSRLLPRVFPSPKFDEKERYTRYIEPVCSPSVFGRHECNPASQRKEDDGTHDAPGPHLGPDRLFGRGLGSAMDAVPLGVVPPLLVCRIQPFDGIPLMPILIRGNCSTRFLFASIGRRRKQFVLSHHDRQVPAGICCCSVQSSTRFFSQEVHDRTHSLAGESTVKMALLSLRETL
jgi:hypothetical protein